MRRCGVDAPSIRVNFVRSWRGPPPNPKHPEKWRCQSRAGSGVQDREKLCLWRGVQWLSFQMSAHATFHIIKSFSRLLWTTGSKKLSISDFSRRFFHLSKNSLIFWLPRLSRSFTFDPQLVSRSAPKYTNLPLKGFHQRLVDGESVPGMTCVASECYLQKWTTSCLH